MTTRNLQVAQTHLSEVVRIAQNQGEQVISNVVSL